MKGQSVELSKWWQTPSAQAAWDRARNRKHLQIETLRAYMKQKREQLQAQLEREEAEYQQELSKR